MTNLTISEVVILVLLGSTVAVGFLFARYWWKISDLFRSCLSSLRNLMDDITSSDRK